MQNLGLIWLSFLLIGSVTTWAQDEPSLRQMERLDRGLVAIVESGPRVVLSWRVLGLDPESLGFHVDREIGGDRQRLTPEPLRNATWFRDNSVELSEGVKYLVQPVLDGRDSGPPSVISIAPNTEPKPYLSVSLQTLPGHTPNDASVGDVDGDGQYEIVLKQEMRGRDNSQRGRTGQTKLEAYRLDGTMLWRIDLGPNIREGAHYTPFLVYDFDGDGCAEVACKTADGTIDGRGKVIGDPKADYRDDRGTVLKGPEYLTIFDGQTGSELASTAYLPPRGDVRDWGDDYGNRSERYLACVAYLDGSRPSLVMCRGYYARTVLVAWNWRDGKLIRLWTFDTDDREKGQPTYRGQGNHNLSVADVDGDGRDEITYGACAIDDNGEGLYSTGLGHGDAIHVSDLDPTRPGLEVFDIHEHVRHEYGIEFRDARTGKILWGQPSRDVARGMAADIDPRYPGTECWAFGPGLRGVWSARGEKISDAMPRSCNMGIWWDGDPLRELLDGTTIKKWVPDVGKGERLLSADQFGCASNNGSKRNPALCADILGDWREELILRTRDNRELRIFCSTIATDLRRPTLMHDPVYRLSVAWQNVGYNQPTQTGFFLGAGMKSSPRPAIRVNR